MEETPSSFVPYRGEQFEPIEMLKRSEAYYQWMNQRRTLREFSDRPVPLAVIENIVMTASTAPSGAHKQPWTFAIVADPITLTLRTGNQAATPQRWRVRLTITRS